MTSPISSIASNSVLILTLLLLLGGGLEFVCSMAETSGPYELNPAIEIYYETNRREQSASAGSPPAPLPVGQAESTRPDLYQQQRRKSDFQDSNLKRYLFKEVDGDGFAVNSPAERKHYINLRELLDTIDASPIYRSGRTSPTDFKLPSAASGKSLLGIRWDPIKPGYSASTKNNRPRHVSLGAEQLSFTGPSNSITDYEWKRVENTRWNNLRGMWGKRSLGASNKWSNIPDGEESLVSRQQQQQLPVQVATLNAEAAPSSFNSLPGKPEVEAGQQKNNL